MGVAAFVAGMVAVVATLGSAVRTVILPRGIPAKLASSVFIAMRSLYRLRLRRSSSYERRDRTMATYAPLSLLALAMIWLTIVVLGYTAMFWSLGGSLRHALSASGSSVLTLGFERPPDLPALLLTLSEAVLGLTLLALLISYLPSLHGAFSRREEAVALLEVRAGAPPSGVTMIERYALIGWIGGLESLWKQWESWFAQIEETHTSFPALVFFRSPQPGRSWVTAAGAVLDGAALAVSSIERRDPDAQLCLRGGFLALRRVADFFDVPYDPDPQPGDPISITREEFDEAFDRLAAADLPMKADRDEAWRDFSGWRVNYDLVLLTLASLTDAPYAPWSSDRSAARFRVRALRRKTGPAGGMQA